MSVGIHCQNKTSVNEDIIRNFYKKYCIAFDQEYNQIDSLRKSICTENLYNTFDSLEYDPFLNSQDITNSMINSLQVEQSENNVNQIIVSYNTPYRVKPVKIYLHVSYFNGVLKVVSIKYEV